MSIDTSGCLFAEIFSPFFPSLVVACKHIVETIGSCCFEELDIFYPFLFFIFEVIFFFLLGAFSGSPSTRALGRSGAQGIFT
jgi:hypothetical protein